MIDKVWERAGMTCVLRHGAFGAPCGYVIVPEGHPLHGAGFEKADALLDVYGGVTFAGDLEEAGYAVGFDMAHACDVDYVRRLGEWRPLRTDDECIAETDRLAEQLSAIAERGRAVRRADAKRGQSRYCDIDERQARAAHEANSMREFEEGRATAEYRAQVDEAYAMAERQAERFPEAADKAYALAERFARRYAEWLNEGYRIEAMCPSILVAGGGNFPTRKKERQNARRNAHMGRYEGIMAIKRRISTVGTGGIQAGDPDALGKLEAKAERLEERHEAMKRANAYCRKHGTLEGFDGVGADEAERIKHDMERFGMSKPFPSWQLSNNLANIKRTRARIEELKREKESCAEDRETEINGEPCTVVEDADIMRLQIVFDGKPEADTRAMLKGAGFRWSPKNGAWQRQLTDNARIALARIDGCGASRVAGAGSAADGFGERDS